MSDLLKKLNTLVRSNLSDLTPSLPRFERSPNLDRQVSELRDRINSALEHEDQLQATANTLRAEVERLDQQADAAVAQGQDAQARHILEQMKRAQQRLDIAESDLAMHQRVAQELIQRVNLLEATVADSKAAQNTPAPVATETASPIEIEAEVVKTDEAVESGAQTQAEAAPSTVQRISGILRQTQELARERINTMTDLINAQTNAQTETQQSESKVTIPLQETPTPTQAMTPASETESAVEPDDPMERRLQRLSKPSTSPPTSTQ